MPLPDDFLFSQSSLQDFETCPRRFQLRYLQRLSWPAVESEPIEAAERLMQRGADFHRLVHQHLVGLDEQTLTGTLDQAEPELKIWWQNYLAHRPAALDKAQTYPELTLSTPLRDHRLLARFDLLAVGDDGAVLIIDWKTSQRKPARDYLARRIQTRVYPYVLVRAGTAYNGGQPIDPAVVKMMYWYAETPDRPELFDYSRTLFDRDEQFLNGLIEQVKTAAAKNEFPLVGEAKPCKYCVYRSYCDRGQKAGPGLDQIEDPQDTLDISTLAWDQIAEIQY